MSYPTDIDMHTAWIQIWDALVATCVAVAGLDTTNVKQGLKFPPVGSPEVQVGPGNYRSMIDDTLGSYYEFAFPIFVFNEDPDLTEGMKDCITWAGKIRKEILTDRSLGNIAGNVVDVSADTNPQSIPG